MARPAGCLFRNEGVFFPRATSKIARQERAAGRAGEGAPSAGRRRPRTAGGSSSRPTATACCPAAPSRGAMGGRRGGRRGPPQRSANTWHTHVCHGRRIRQWSGWSARLRRRLSPRARRAERRLPAASRPPGGSGGALRPGSSPAGRGGPLRKRAQWARRNCQSVQQLFPREEDRCRHRETRHLGPKRTCGGVQAALPGAGARASGATGPVICHEVPVDPGPVVEQREARREAGGGRGCGARGEQRGGEQLRRPAGRGTTHSGRSIGVEAQPAPQCAMVTALSVAFMRSHCPPVSLARWQLEKLAV